MRILNALRSIGVAAVAPLDRRFLEARVMEIDADVLRNKKLTKQEALYLSIPPFPPLYWEYRCAWCRQFNAPLSCNWVEGKISQDGWCTLWIPPQDFERPFSWLKRIGEFPNIAQRILGNLQDRSPDTARVIEGQVLEVKRS